MKTFTTTATLLLLLASPVSYSFVTENKLDKQRVYAILLAILMSLAIWGLLDDFVVDLAFPTGLGGWVAALLLLFLTLLQRENDKKAED